METETRRDQKRVLGTVCGTLGDVRCCRPVELSKGSADSFLCQVGLASAIAQLGRGLQALRHLATRGAHQQDTDVPSITPSQ